MAFLTHEFKGRELVCAAVLNIDLNNNPQSVQKQAYEKCQTRLNEKSHRVLKITLKAFQ